MSRKALVALAVGFFAVFMFIYMYRTEIPLANEAYVVISQMSTETVGYLKNPISILEQFKQHAMGYTAIGSFTGGAVLAVAKWATGRAKNKLLHVADVKIGEVTKQLSDKTSEIETLNYKLEKKDEIITTYEELVRKQKALFDTKIVDVQQKILPLEKRIENLQTENNTLQRTISNAMKEKKKVVA